MTKPTTNPKQRRQPWFAPRQVYVRTGQGSSYVELSSMLQIGVAIGFGIIALWLLGASYSAAKHVMDKGSSASLLAELETSKEKLGELTAEASKIPSLEAALVDAKTSIAKAQQLDETAALSAELAQTQQQLEDLRMELSKSKSEEATLQAKLEALAAEGKTSDSQAAQEAVSLHTQLEDAFLEIEDLEKARDEADARVAALTAENAEKDDNAERNQTLLNAATDEIERLQESIADEARVKDGLETELKQELDRLTLALGEEKSAREDLQQRADRMSEELSRREQEAAEAAEEDEVDVAAAAERHAEAIAADLKEADLLATIDDLRSQISSQKESENNPDVEELKEKLAIAEAEIETLLKNTLSSVDNELEEDEKSAVTAAIVPEADNAEEIDRLETELSTAKSEIIKLKSDVRAAKKRLAEQTEKKTVSGSKPDNTAKLQQQLASTRSRLQQTNKALADAKLREVAIDLALISVVPSPSPPAPR